MDSNDGQKSPCSSINIPTIALNDEPLEIPDAQCTEGNSGGPIHPPPYTEVAGVFDNSTLSPFSAVIPELGIRREVIFPDNVSMGSFGSAALRYTPRSQLRAAVSSFLGMHLPDMDRVSRNEDQTTAASRGARRPRGCCGRCARAPWAWICWVSLMLLVFILNPFGAVMIMIEVCADKSSDSRKRVCRVLQFTAGIVGLLAVIVIVLCWRLLLSSDSYSAAGMDFDYRTGPCDSYTCCPADSIYYDSYCYWSPVTTSLCPYIVQWTCNTDRYLFPDVCNSDRCCRPFEIFYASYCYHNASVATSPSPSGECRYTVDRACYRARYFSYSSNGCPSSALYAYDSFCYYK